VRKPRPGALITEEMMHMKEQKKLNNALIIPNRHGTLTLTFKVKVPYLISNETSSLYIEYIIKSVLFRTFQYPSWDKK
jgi:hypothetical protein